jgi:hypothetical protein
VVRGVSAENELGSAGHKLGQLIGDWFERCFVLPLLTRVADDLDLFLDNRFIDRPARGEKILWPDAEGNEVDYDFVLELHGSQTDIGLPVAFIESFWRRGSRHSKDKARDDSGKLRPMRATYPTARFLGIIAAGHFTGPARDLVRSQDIDLFYVPKDKVVRAFRDNGLLMDYPDKAPEVDKRRIAAAFESGFSPEGKKETIVDSLIDLMGKAVVDSYTDRVRAKLSALPQEFRFALRHDSAPVVFESLPEATAFLQDPTFAMAAPVESYLYQIIYSDGSEFEETAVSLDELRALHGQIAALAEHMNILKQ